MGNCHALRRSLRQTPVRRYVGNWQQVEAPLKSNFVGADRYNYCLGHATGLKGKARDPDPDLNAESATEHDSVNEKV